jgi:4-hydroxy-3-methylbut-2-enyl diphosphate reductase
MQLLKCQDAQMEIILARPRGFCGGVIRAVSIVNEVLTLHGPPVFVLHEIVHNRHVVERLREQGALFIESVEEAAPGGIVIFSAHGVSDGVFERARERGLRVVDATCPLVKKVHLRARRYSREGLELVIIGHKGHAEVEGTKGCVNGRVHVVGTVREVEDLTVEDPARIAYVTQTTLNIQNTHLIITALKKRFPSLRGAGLADVCRATQNRQKAVHRLCREIDILLVVGSRNSSNSNRLREVGEQSGCLSFLIEDSGEIDPAWFRNRHRVGVTAGASAPEVLVQGVVERLQALGDAQVREMVGGSERTAAEMGTSRSELDVQATLAV